jgi:hypothetical protein
MSVCLKGIVGIIHTNCKAVRLTSLKCIGWGQEDFANIGNNSSWDYIQMRGMECIQLAHAKVQKATYRQGNRHWETTEGGITWRLQQSLTFQEKTFGMDKLIAYVNQICISRNWR